MNVDPKYLSLEAIFKLMNTDKFDHNYHIPYEKFMIDKRNENIKLLEIGTRAGLGIVSFINYFYNSENSNFYCMDLYEKHLHGLRHMGINCYECDQGSREELSKAMEYFDNTNFDFIVDDGSHKSKDQQVSLGFLFKHLKPGGIYFIEDLFHLLAEDGNNYCKEALRTDELIRYYEEKNKILKSKDGKFTKFTDEEIDYLEKNIDKCIIFNLDSKDDITSGGGPGPRPIAIITKKR